ncbi:dephospho-CoA kinase [Arenicella sp. 4NH20-0111]|uniref:dephospho-CoA kinase n=1 Tax=Arenicella sp. 4NH20-0111 TaxID=3127648 RepID=UPI0031037090
MNIIGLSGGIGSGKTVVSDHFGHLGVSVVDTDVIARKVVEPGKPALDSLVQEFGSSILNSDGSLNRSNLRELAFASSSNKRRLDAITHPAIRIETVKQINQSEGSYCIVVVPLLYKESPFLAMMNRVLIVTADREVKIARVQKRNNFSRDQVIQIMDTQLSDEKRLEFADDVIKNDSSLEHVYREVEVLHETYSSLT